MAGEGTRERGENVGRKGTGIPGEDRVCEGRREHWRRLGCEGLGETRDARDSEGQVMRGVPANPSVARELLQSLFIPGSFWNVGSRGSSRPCGCSLRAGVPLKVSGAANLRAEIEL